MKEATTTPYTVMYLDHTAKWSGGEVALLRTLEAIDRTRVHPIVVLAEDGAFVQHLCNLNIETLILPLDESIREVRKDSLSGGAIVGHLGTALRLLGYAAAIARLAKQRNVGIIHTNSLKSDMYGALAGRLANIPVIWHVRDHISDGYLPRAAVLFFRHLARRLPAYLITNSQSTLDTLYLAGQRPSRVVTSGLPLRGLSLRQAVIHDGLNAAGLGEKSNPARGIFHDPPRIGIVGRIVAWKGQHIFLQAASRVVKSGHDARFQIIGGALFGEQSFEAELKAQAQSLGIADKVEFMGFRSDVPDLLRQLDILVHASTTPEPFGQVVIEGMAAGLPVIASDGGGVREIVTHGENALLTPMGDSDALGDALIELLTDPAKAQTMARNGYLHVRRHFTAAQSARKLEKVYDDIMLGRILGRTIPVARSLEKTI